MSDVLKIYGDHEPNTIDQMWMCMGVGSTYKGVLCADGHLGYAQPVGGVIAYENHVSISGVGFDIGCGNMAVQLDMTLGDIKNRLPHISKDIGRTISFGLGRYNQTKDKIEHELFDSPVWKEVGLEYMKEKAIGQLGTVGGGNHYVDLFVEKPLDILTEDSLDAWYWDDQPIWIGVHFGSRGFGHKVATQFLKYAGGKDGMMVAPAIVEIGTDLGDRYIAAMELAGDYAYAGREWVVDKVRRMLSAKVKKTVHNHHNYAWKETHDGCNLWVVRKGATPAFPGQEGFVGGSMGDNAVILEGIDTEAARQSLYSTVHGAGRVHSRSACKNSFTRNQMNTWLKEREVMLVGGDVDESPMAYRRLNDVLKHHDDTVKINHVLRPILVHMAAPEIRDPYKD